jgi:hypothetical protein
MAYDTTALCQELAKLCLYRIEESEDFTIIEPAILKEVHEELCRGMAQAMEQFDNTLLHDKPSGWKVKDARYRNLITEFGLVSYKRRIYIDEFGDRRNHLDELLDIRKGYRLSANAFHTIATFASDIPYERSARLFCRHTSSALSATGVQNVLREVGALLKERDEKRRSELFDEGLCPDSELERDEICAEVDGIWIHLQKDNKHNAEVKAFCAYGGKKDGKRENVIHHACIDEVRTFSEQAIAKMATRYSLSTLNTCHIGHDGGGWCKQLPNYFKGTKCINHLDPWHINRLLEAALVLKSARKVAYKCLHEGDIERLIEFLEDKIRSKPKNVKKIEEFLRYIVNNQETIAIAGPTLGTMESTNAHVYAARMKVWGGGWSRRGASDMARIRSTIFSGEAIPHPKTQSFYTKKEQKRREKLRQARFEEVEYTVIRSEGKGYEMPSGTLQPFSSEQSLLKMWPTWVN